VGDPKRFLLRVDRGLYDALERWAADDLRSVNGQIEFLLRESLRRAGRLPGRDEDQGGPQSRATRSR
jgi:hypothetical protein